MLGTLPAQVVHARIVCLGIREGEMRTLMIGRERFCQHVEFLPVVHLLFSLVVNNAVITLIIMIAYPFKWYLD